MTRRRFSSKAYATRLLEFNGKCAECQCKVGGANGLDWDHIIPLEMWGEDTLENLQPLCKSCHKAKSKEDARHIAKGKRMQQRQSGIKRQSARGFKAWRKFNGEIVRR